MRWYAVTKWLLCMDTGREGTVYVAYKCRLSKSTLPREHDLLLEHRHGRHTFRTNVYNALRPANSRKSVIASVSVSVRSFAWVSTVLSSPMVDLLTHAARAK